MRTLIKLKGKEEKRHICGEFHPHTREECVGEVEEFISYKQKDVQQELTKAYNKYLGLINVLWVGEYFDEETRDELEKELNKLLPEESKAGEMR